MKLGRTKTVLSLAVMLLSGIGLQAQTIQEATKEIEKNRFSSATTMLNKILQKEPNNAAAYYHLGTIYLYNEQEDSAKYFFDKAMEVNNADPLSYIGIGRLQLDKKQYAEAKASFEKALAIGKGKYAYVMNQVADAYVDAVVPKEADYAIDLANKSKELDKKNLYYMITLGDAHRLKGDGSKGVAEYKAAAEKDAKFALAPLRIGELYFKLRTFDEAESYFNKVIAIDPNYAPVYKDLGELYYQRGKRDKAIESYKKYLDMVGRSIPERIRFGTLHFANKNYAEAINELKSVQPNAPENPLLLRILSYSQYETGAYEEGIKNLEKYFEVMKPKQDKIIGKDYEYYGRLLSKNGRDEDAIANLRKGLENDTTATELYDVIAESYAKQKKYTEAANIIREKQSKTIANPNNQDHFSLGRFLYMGSNFAGADSAFGKVNEFFPNYAVGYLYRARSADKLDTKSQGFAKPHYEAFIEKVLYEGVQQDTVATTEKLVNQADVTKYKKELIEAYSYLAVNGYNTKNDAAMKQNIAKVLELDPNNKQIKELQKQATNRK